MTQAGRRPAGARRPLRLIHTSDIHVGADYDPPDARSGESGAVVALGRLAPLVADVRADAVMVVGDLFDNARIGEALVARTWELLEAVARPVVILPGNHDPYMEGGVYRRSAHRRPANVFLLRDPAGQTLDFPQLHLQVWGRPHMSWDDYRPTEGAPAWAQRDGPSYWRVALVHGHWMRDAADAHRSYQVHDHDLQALDAHYVALGHWDLHQPIGPDGVVAYYSGSPSRSGAFALVDLSDAGVHVREVGAADRA